MTEMTALQAAGLWSGLLILVLVVLSARVVMTAGAKGSFSGTAGTRS